MDSAPSHGRFAVIPTRDRPGDLATCVAAVAPQVDGIIIVDNLSNPPVVDHPGFDRGFVVVVHNDDDPPNLSRLWNLGLDLADKVARLAHHDTWDVAVLNDDAVPPPGWMETVGHAMRAHGATAGCSHPHVAATVLHGPQAPIGLATRLTGWAFVLRGETGLRADERLAWWCGDDDLSVRARHAGGVVHVPGYDVPNHRANTTTVGALAEQAARDMQTFVDIHGQRPW